MAVTECVYSGGGGLNELVVMSRLTGTFGSGDRLVPQFLIGCDVLNKFKYMELMSQAEWVAYGKRPDVSVTDSVNIEMQETTSTGASVQTVTIGNSSSPTNIASLNMSDANEVIIQPNYRVTATCAYAIKLHN